MSNLKVCISFDYENDKYSRNVIRLWNRNKYIDFNINDKTPTEIDTYRIDRIKAGLTTKISESDVLLVISGRYINSLHKDRNLIGTINWQNWECKKAIELNKKIILVKLSNLSEVPKELLRITRIDVNGLELNKLKNALELICVH